MHVHVYVYVQLCLMIYANNVHKQVHVYVQLYMTIIRKHQDESTSNAFNEKPFCSVSLN